MIDTKKDQVNKHFLKSIVENDSAQELDGQLYAAVDLGSNSFHLVVSRYKQGKFVVVNRYRESVRLAGGIDKGGNLSLETRQHAIACLEKFSQLLKLVLKENIRVVGTYAMRQICHNSDFFHAAEATLGFKVEVIHGHEEARLIYLGVVKGSEFGNESRIVFDIGGGSTEIIVGANDEPQHCESVDIGCVSISNKFFADGLLDAERFEQAVLYCELAIQPVVKHFKTQGWQHAVGCSKTIRTLSSILDGMEWTNGEITKSALDKLYQYVIDVGDIDSLQLPRLTSDFRPVFAGGLSVIKLVFDMFDLERMQVSDYALRDGMLQDLVKDPST